MEPVESTFFRDAGNGAGILARKSEQAITSLLQAWPPAQPDLHIFRTVWPLTIGRQDSGIGPQWRPCSSLPFASTLLPEQPRKPALPIEESSEAAPGTEAGPLHISGAPDSNAAANTKSSQKTPLLGRLRDNHHDTARDRSTGSPLAFGSQSPSPSDGTEAKVSDKSQQRARSWLGGSLPGWFPKSIPNLQPFWVILAPPGQPDKKRLLTVQDFFKYTEEEGKQFWRELDRDKDGRVSTEDVKAVLKQRNLPESYGSEFIKAARGNRWWSGSIDWEEFKALVDEREPKMLKAFTSLQVNSDGTLEPKSIKGTLAKVGVAGTDKHVDAMIRALGLEEDGMVSYGKFRNFLMLLPEAKLTGMDPSAIWFEAAAVVPFGPPPSERSNEKRTGKMLLTAALAGGIASCVSTLALFPLDTMKTRMQYTAGATFASIAKSAPNIGARGLYRGIIPAATGNFVSHGVRTFSYEASFTALTTLTRGAAELQMQGLSSGIGTFLGTCIRIPCEVIKQRLQIGRHGNMLEAIRVATVLEGPRGLFRGTVATLSREVPFYVLGIVFFEQLKRVAKGSSFGGKGRELAPWETLALGALAGALASVTTCPADVMKTRVMTAAAEKAVDPKRILLELVQNEGVGALFKGALFRAAWTAPQGAMNFSGYELAKKALSQQDNNQETEFQLEPAV